MATTPKKSLKRKTVKPTYIYWCCTDLPEDYMFIYGNSVLQTKKTYNRLNGVIEHVHIKVQKICEIPQAILKEMKIKEASDDAEDELLLKSGIEFLHKDRSSFRYNGKPYREEGILDDKLDKDKLAVYLFKQKEEMRYKIGHSKDVGRRLKQLSKPDQYELLCIIPTKSARKLETEILSYFARFQFHKEYVKLDKWASFLLESTFLLYSIEFFESEPHHIVSEMFKDKLAELTKMIQSHKLNTEPAKDIMVKGLEIWKSINDWSEKENNQKWEAWINKLMPLPKKK